MLQLVPSTFRHSNSDSSLDPRHRKLSKGTSRGDTGLVSQTPSDVPVKRIKRSKLFPFILSAKSKAAKSYQNADCNIVNNVNNEKTTKSSKPKS